MDSTDKRWLRRLRDQFGEYFIGKRVVEFGSLNINGTIRRFFEDCDYTGIDWRPGDCVDIVSLAHEVDLPAKSFDVVISCSMLEHDPYWDKSIRRMVEVMKDDGILIVGWGGGYNNPHEPEASPLYDPRSNSKAFHPRPGQDVLDLVRNSERIGGETLYLQQFAYRHYLIAKKKNPIEKAWGFLSMVAFKDPKKLKNPVIHKIKEKDKRSGVKVG